METDTLSGIPMYVLMVIEHGSRRIRVLGATAHPTASWVAQAAKNLVMDLEDLGCRARFMIRDRDGKFPDLFDAALKDAGIDVVISGIQMPRMNSITERWAQTCRRELLDRTLIWNQQHLLHTLREFEQFYNGHRPHQGIANTRPLPPLPPPIDDPDTLARLDRSERSARYEADRVAWAVMRRHGGALRGRDASAVPCQDARAVADAAGRGTAAGAAALPGTPGRSG